MFIIIYSILLFIAIGSLILLPESQNNFSYSSNLALILLAVLGCVACLIIQNKAIQKNKRNPKVGIFVFFLMAYICVHFQTFANLIVFPDYLDIFNAYDNKFVNTRTALISLIGLLAYLIGNSLAMISNKKISCHMHRTIKVSHSLKNIIDFFLLISVFIFYYFNGRMYLSGGYSQEMLNSMSGTMSTYSTILVELLISCSVMVNLYLISDENYNLSAVGYIKSFSLIFYSAVLIYILLAFAFGDRGPIITIVLSMMFGYVMVTKRQFRFRTLVFWFAIGGLLVSVIGIARMDRTEGSYNMQNDYVMTIISLNSVCPFTEELAGSNRTAIWAVESTPSSYPFRNGLFTLNNLIGIIPFSNTALNAFGINLNGDNHYSHSSGFLSWYDQGDYVTSGVGTSTIADIYLDFGVFGVFIVLLMLGWLFNNLDYAIVNYKAKNLSLIAMVSCIVLFSNSIYLARSVMLFQARSIVWLFVLSSILIKFYGKKTKKSIVR